MSRPHRTVGAGASGGGAAAAALAQPRPSSSRSPFSVNCQNIDCCAVLLCSSIPVEYEQILRQLMPPLAADADADPAAPAAAAEGGGALQTLSDFRALADRGDSTGFAALVAQLCASRAATELPLCDACMEQQLTRRERAHAEACVQRDDVLRMRDALTAPGGRSAAGAGASATEGSSGVGSRADQLSALAAAAAAAASASRSGAGVGGLLDELRAEAAALQAEAAAAQQRAARARALRAPLRQRRAQLAALEAALWGEGRELARQLQAGKERAYTLQLRDLRGRELLSKLRCLLAPSDAFFVWHRGPFATINSARIGRLPGLPVDWPEINAALGQLAFLLSTVAGRVGYIFTKFRIIPMGSYSRLVPTGDARASASLDLFYDDGNFFFAQSRLNSALKALVACVAELGAFAEASDRSFRLPYAVAAAGDKVAGDLHVTMGKDAPWTRAMKLVATNVKWLVSWSFRSGSAQGGAGPALLGYGGMRGGGHGGGAGGGGGGVGHE